MPKVSVIIPNYNHALFLKDRIQSVLNQSFQDFEIILLDDASTDNSLEVLEYFKTFSKITHTIINEKNSGSPFKQWQKGLELAQGEYIWIAESDDTCNTDFLKTILEQFQKDQKLGICYVASNWIDKDSKIVKFLEYENHLLKTQLGKELIINEMTKGCLIYNASSCVFKKSLLVNINFNEITTFKFTGDYLFWVQLFKNTNVFRINKQLNNFRTHHGNVSGAANKKGLQFSEGFKIIEYIFKHYKISFFKKRKIYILWALKVKLNKDIEPKLAISYLPKEVGFWFFVLKMLRISSF